MLVINTKKRAVENKVKRMLSGGQLCKNNAGNWRTFK